MCSMTSTENFYYYNYVSVGWGRKIRGPVFSERLCTLKIPSVAAVFADLCSLRVGIIMKPLPRQNYFLPVFDILYIFSSGS